MNAVEIFTPYFSQAIANVIVHNHKLGTPLNVMEVANGSTTHLCAMLAYMKEKLPNVYKNMKYYLLTDDVYFKPLSVPEEFADKVHIQDIVSNIGKIHPLSSYEKCLHLCDSAFLILNDVMSGLPHDKVRVSYGTKGNSIEQYQQGIVVQRSADVYEEVFL